MAMSTSPIDPSRIDAALGALTHAATDIGAAGPGDAAAAAPAAAGSAASTSGVLTAGAAARLAALDAEDAAIAASATAAARARAAGPGGAASVALPWDHAAFVARVRTFTPTTWFAKPEALNPIACARHGWVNGAADELHCRACGGTLAFRFSGRLETHSVDAAARAFAPQLRAAHKPLCVWHDDACPDEFARVPARTPA